MRPCQHCGSPIELHIKECDQCGTEQVETVGLTAETSEIRDIVEADEGSDALFNDSRVIVVPLVVCFCVIGGAVWLISGSVSMGLGALVATIAVCSLFLDISFFFG